MDSFRTLGIEERFIRAIEELGFQTPTQIQEEAIPILIKNEADLIGLAQTGTGKTAAFGLPLLQLIEAKLRKPQGLILCPTRELCIQIQNDIKKFIAFEKHISSLAVYGGAGIEGQISSLKKGVHIVVATPGRMLDLLKRKAVDFSNIAYTILDEADEMLNMGFQEELNAILATTPPSKRTWLFSATMPAEVRRIASNYMKSPLEVKAGKVNVTNVNIDHEYYIVNSRDKFLALKRIIDYNPEIFSIVFARTKRTAQEVAEQLIKDGYDADSLHGDLSQAQREKTLNRFRNKSLQVLIATDVAARGIDIDDITHVINYSLPDDIESYTHRSGRTARAGKTGISISIINPAEVRKIKAIEKTLGIKMVRCDLPSGFDVCEKQLFSLIHKVQKVNVNEEQIAAYVNRILDELEAFDKEEIIKRFVSLEFNRFLDDYKKAPNLNKRGEERNTNRREKRYEERNKKGRRTREKAEEGYKRLFLNVGFEDGLTRGDLFRLITKNTSVNGSSVGRIDVKGVFSFVEIKDHDTKRFLNEFNDFEMNNRALRADYAKERQAKVL